MNDNEKYLFDLQGYLTVENALDAAQLIELASRVVEEIGITNQYDYRTSISLN